MDTLLLSRLQFTATTTSSSVSCSGGRDAVLDS